MATTIILQHIHKSNHYDVHSPAMLHVSNTFLKMEGKKSIKTKMAIKANNSSSIPQLLNTAPAQFRSHQNTLSTCLYLPSPPLPEPQ